VFLSLLQATPYWDQSAVPVNVAKQKDPFIGKVLPRPPALKRRALSSEGSHFMRAAARVPRPRGETCPVSTEGGTRRVQSVREGGGGGVSSLARRCLARQIVSVQRMVGADAPGEICNVLLDHGGRCARARPERVCLGNAKEAEGGRVVSDLLRGAGREVLTSLSPLLSH